MKLTILLLLILSSCQTASAQPLYVDDNAPNDPAPGNPLISDPEENGTLAHPFDAIQKAIDYITDPNTQNEVIILPGKYTGQGNRDIDFKGKPITVRGTEPDDPNTVAATVIDCQGTETEPHRGFHFHSGETETSVLEGLTVSNGFAETGGGILCDHSSPSIRRCVIRNNTAKDESFKRGGGGLHGFYSDVNIVESSIRNNSGGGMTFYMGSPAVIKCSISSNHTRSGGGIRCFDSSAHLLDSIFTSNVARSGGALSCYNDLTSITNCVMTSNVATNEVGGGGAIFSDRGNLNIQSSVIQGNLSLNNGGAIRVQGCSVALKNSSIVGNRADKRGGGVFCDDGTIVTLNNTILWGNLATEGEQISFPLFNDDWEQRDLHVRFSNIQDGKEAIEGEWTRLDWQDGNIDTDPLFADPGQWDGDTWIEGDYHLKSYSGRWEPVSKTWFTDSEHSPCIDAGNPSSDYANEPQYNGKRINMGAYGNTEFASKTPNCPEPPIGDLDEDCKVTFADFAIFAAHWMDCNLDPPIACD